MFSFITNIKAIEIKSSNMVLYNLNENVIIDELNKDKKISIASMTKIMTVLVAIENISDINEKIILTKDIFEDLISLNASVAGFYAGEEVAYIDLLYGAFLPSGADATKALAINISGSEENFVKLMNKKAIKLNLKNTNFVNTSGLDNVNHYSSVDDVAIILKYALSNSIFKKIFLADNYTTTDKYLKMYSTLDKTMNNYKIKADYIIGGKTGYTIDAGRCLASVAYDKHNNVYYLLVTANAPTETNYSHLLDAKNIYEYYFKNYSYYNIINVNDVLITLDTKYAKENKLEIKATDTFLKYLPNNFDKSKVRLEYEGINVIKYSTKLGTKLGNIIVTYDNELLGNIDIVLNDKLHFSLIDFLTINWVTITLILIIIYIIVKFKILKKHKRLYKNKKCNKK